MGVRLFDCLELCRRESLEPLDISPCGLSSLQQKMIPPWFPIWTYGEKRTVANWPKHSKGRSPGKSTAIRSAPRTAKNRMAPLQGLQPTKKKRTGSFSRTSILVTSGTRRKRLRQEPFQLHRVLRRFPLWLCLLCQPVIVSSQHCTRVRESPGCGWRVYWNVYGANVLGSQCNKEQSHCLLV